MDNKSLMSASSGVASDDPSGSRRARRRRPATEKRRLQNRESQRERQKRLIIELRQAAVNRTANARALPVAGRPLQPRPAGRDSSNSSSWEVSDILSQGQVHEPSRVEDLDSSKASETLLQSQPPHQPGDQPNWYPNGFDDSLLDQLSIPSLDTSWEAMSSWVSNNRRPSTHSDMQLVSSRQEPYEYSLPAVFGGTGSLPAPSSIQGDLTHVSNDQSMSPWLGNMASRTSPMTPLPVTGSHNTPPPYLSHVDNTPQILASHLGTLNLLQIDDTLENRYLLRNALSQKHTISSIFLAGLRSLSDPSPRSPPQNIPNIYANHLSLHRLSTIQAYLSNANALSFNIPSLMHPDAPSPFYRHDVTTTSAATAYISTLPASYPPHLRPTPPQILHPHLPFIDLLPFPTLRARAVTLTAVIPPLIDLRELKIDILNDGLVCWSGTNGKRLGGQPWDMRTWEAAVWFLKKWWVLVGGESDEVSEGTKWWRRLRGEEAVGE